MLKENRKTLIITSIVTVLPILAGILFWNRLPEQMATHFGVNNEADGFSSRAFAVFGLPLFCLAMLWVCAWFTSKDPRKKNISPRIFSLVLWIIPAVSLICALIVYSYNLGMRTDISRLMELLMGVLFVVIGNFMPKTRHNYTIGIRVPWTLDNEENWNRTHRFAGRLWVAGGILLILLALAGLMKGDWFIVLVFAITMPPCAYSYWLHEKKGL